MTALKATLLPALPEPEQQAPLCAWAHLRGEVRRDLSTVNTEGSNHSETAMPWLQPHEGPLLPGLQTGRPPIPERLGVFLMLGGLFHLVIFDFAVAEVSPIAGACGKQKETYSYFWNLLQLGQWATHRPL